MSMSLTVLALAGAYIFRKPLRILSEQWAKDLLQEKPERDRRGVDSKNSKELRK